MSDKKLTKTFNKNGTPYMTPEEYNKKMDALIKKHCRKNGFWIEYDGPSIPLPPIDPRQPMGRVRRKRR